MLRDLESRDASPLTLSAARRRASIRTSPSSSTRSARGRTSGANDAYNRFDVREAELDLRAAIDPRADGVLVLAFERDVREPALPRGRRRGRAKASRASANIEEAYAFFHDFGVPNLTAKLGRFHVRFGRQNMLHLHDLPTSDPPLVNQAFLAPEALIDSGLSLSYVIPPRFVAEQYIELIAEILTGEGADSESPTLSGDIVRRFARVQLSRAVEPRHHARHEPRAGRVVADRPGQHAASTCTASTPRSCAPTRPAGSTTSSSRRRRSTASVDGERRVGLLRARPAAAPQGLVRRPAPRLDGEPADAARRGWAVSPYVSWYWSEFLRFRLEYQHRDGDVDERGRPVYFQATYIFGAHPPHPYWSMR